MGVGVQTTAHGVKIDPTKRMVVAIAPTSGQIAGTGTGSRTSGSASMTVVSSCSLSSTRSPVTTGSASR
jgi:hypothetical protein